MINNHKPYGVYEKCIKRPLDCILATCALVVLSPVMGITALLVKKKLGSPVIFKASRPGRNEKIFTLYKFRSMTDARDEHGDLLPDAERLTTFGKRLRSTSLDELPELLNIIKGDMAVVGPRPLAKSYLDFYTDEEKHRHDVRPGLTGLAQVHGRNAITWEKRFEYDLKYISKITFFGDCKIIIDTIAKVFKHEGITQGATGPKSLSIERAWMKEEK
jgi:undecaprenyl phosphate N,N'-diacetylbacillosamine 1-phosphate transferase